MSVSMNNYDALLDRALSKITQSTGTGERFELPIAMVQIIGQRTIVVNFSDVVDRLNRDPHHVLKYLAKEMATAGSYESGRGYFQGRFSRETINRLRSEEHTSELQSRLHLVCRLLLEKKKKKTQSDTM